MLQDRFSHSERYISVPRILDKKEVALWLRCSVRQVDVLRSNENLPFRKLGGLVRFDAMEVLMWLKGRKLQKGGV